MKTPSSDLSKVFESMSRFDHSDINALRALQGRMVTIPVRLERLGRKKVKGKGIKFEKVAAGTVTLMPLRAQMECAAVYLFENVLTTHGMDLSWDRAVAGQHNTIIDPLTYTGQDDIMAEMSRHDRRHSLQENIARIGESYKAQNENGKTPPSQYQKGIDISAAIVANTAIIRSEDLERFLFNQKSAFEKFFGFHHHRLEF